MRGASRESVAALLDGLESLIGRTGAEQRRALAVDLFAVSSLLDSNAALRRALTDPSREGEAKAALATRLLTGQVGAEALDVVSGAVRRRWSGTRDLGDALDAAGTHCALAAAEAQGRLADVEDELFRFSRIVVGDRGLLRALTERRAAASDRDVLVERLLAGRSAPETAMLARRIATTTRGRTIEGAFEGVLAIAAERRERLIAHVTAAVPLTERQQERLGAALAARYGRPMRLAVEIDRDVVGGLRVEVGDEILDGTLSRRIDAAATQVSR